MKDMQIVKKPDISRLYRDISRISFLNNSFFKYIKKSKSGKSGYIILIFMLLKIQNFSLFLMLLSLYYI